MAGLIKPPKRAKKGGFCCYCKRGPLLASTDRSNLSFTWDHINPRARGSGRKVPCCRKCNNLKGSLSPSDWFWFIDNHPGWWKTFRTNGQVEALVAAERVRRVRTEEEPISKEPMGSSATPMLRGRFNG